MLLLLFAIGFCAFESVCAARTKKSGGSIGPAPTPKPTPQATPSPTASPSPSATPKPYDIIVGLTTASISVVTKQSSQTSESKTYKVVPSTQVQFQGTPIPYSMLRTGMRVTIKSNADPSVADSIAADNPPSS